MRVGNQQQKRQKLDQIQSQLQMFKSVLDLLGDCPDVHRLMSQVRAALDFIDEQAKVRILTSDELKFKQAMLKIVQMQPQKQEDMRQCFQPQKERLASVEEEIRQQLLSLTKL